MDIKEYQHVPELVEAVKVLGGQVPEVVAWINKHSNLKGIIGRTALRGRSGEYVDIQTPEGMRRAYLGDYVLHDGGGEFWPVAASIFERRFSELGAAGE
ncbi:hypothetical protein SAMN05421874_12842 [Nonomuraea maritima]|uniref:Uncharacterized protein n=1 Tax=Nonomuraea maritima TaxID=683260 RepID=A0A1G9MHZ7_9ACTN|nr:hypothetical protein [Nonomuraea maritima]SDL73713.1 hypothetical protein SAMN05421874_12842 [Nonomuraea maritima]